MTRQSYFEYNGNKYYTGTIFRMKYNNQLIDGTFVCYMPELDRYVYKFLDKTGRMQQACSPSSMFWSKVDSITDRRNSQVYFPRERQMKDRYVDGLPLGWMWYIFLMAISTIFKDAIGLWILISVVFFNWRKKKIKEEGTYIEW